MASPTQLALGMIVVGCIAGPLASQYAKRNAGFRPQTVSHSIPQAQPPQTPAPGTIQIPPAGAPVMRAIPVSAAASTRVELYADRMGHYRTDAQIEGAAIPVLVDTGATLVSLTANDAQRIGLRLSDDDYKYATSTANGVARIARVQLREVKIGGIRIYDVPAAVHRDNAMGITLLGMSFLSKLSKVEVANGRLVVQQ